MQYQDIPGLNYSLAKEILKSPAHYKAALVEERKQTPEMRIGTLCHTALLEPSKFVEMVKVGPAVKKTMKAWKDFEATVPEGCEALTQDEYDMISAIVDQAELALASIKVDGNVWETETAVTKEYNGVTLKGRPDLVTVIDGERVCVDLKTSRDCTPWAFSAEVNSRKYHMQAAWYRELTGATSHILLAVEKEPPFAWRVYKLDKAAMDEGQRLMDEAVALFSTCAKLDSWPGYDTSLTELSLPKYAFTNQE
jgi:exodeoxyribonuclease VIII